MPERQCHGCTRQVQWGCEARKIVWRDEKGKPQSKWVNPSKLPLTIDGEDTYACPRQGIRENPKFWERIFMFYGMFKRGFLPGAGAVEDQSHSLVQIFRLIDDANTEIDDQLEKERASKANRAQGRGLV